MIKESILITILTIISSLLGLIVQIIIAGKYGTGINLDAYLYSISLPVFTSSLIASLLSYTISPKIASRIKEVNKQNRLIVTILTLSIIIATAIMIISPGMVWLQEKMIPKSSAMNNINNMKELFYLGWLIGSTQVIMSTGTAILNGLKKPIYSVTMNFGPYIGMLVFLLVTKNNEIINLGLGLLSGTIISIVLSIYPMREKIINNWQEIEWIEIKNIIFKAPYTIIAMSCFSAYTIIDAYWAPHAGEGVLATLGYTQRIMIALGNLAVAGPSALISAKFAELINENEINKFNKTFSKIVLSTASVVIGLMVFIYYMGGKLVSFLFVRGAFSTQDAVKVELTLKYCLPGMFFMLLSSVFLRILFCFQYQDKKIAFLGILWIIAYFILSGALIVYSEIGIAIAYSLTWLISFLYISILLIREIKIKFYVEEKYEK